MKTYKTKIIAVIAGLIVWGCMFTSCRKSPASWDTQVLAPVINANLSINDILTSSYIKNNNDSTVSLVYTDSLYNLNIDTILTIPDTVIPYTEPWVGATYTFTPGSEIYGGEKTSLYKTGSVELTEGILQSGYLTFMVRNPLSQPVDYAYKVLNIINVKNDSDTLSVTVTIPPNSSVTQQKPLGGYKIDFTGPSHNGYNEITTRIQIYLDPSANPLVLTPANDTLASANVSFLNIVPYYAKGYFGTTTKTFGPQSVAFPVFNNIIAGKLNIQNVSVNLTLKNGFGVDASLLLSSLYSYNKYTHDTVHLTTSPGVGVVGSTIHVNRATSSNNPSSPVNPSVLNFAINPSNSNILQWLDNMPTAIGYKLSVTTDPLGNVSGSNDFAYYGYGINANINITVPLSLIASNLILVDTLAVNFAGSGGANQHVKSGSLTIYASNGFPFSAGLQLYLLNNNNVMFDSVFIPSQSIAAAPVNNTGVVTAPKSSVLTISLDAAHTQELFNTKRVVLYARFNMGSLPSTYEKIYDYYQLGLKLVANFDYQIN